MYTNVLLILFWIKFHHMYEPKTDFIIDTDIRL